MRMGRMPTRRAFLFGGLGGLGLMAAAGAGALADVLPGGPRLRDWLGMTGPDGHVPDVPAGPVQVERVRSTARGRDVDLIVMRPAGAPADLPVCLALHGRGEGAQSLVRMGMPKFLTAAVRDGVPPFAMVAVDVGERYLVPVGGDDPLRMLVDEVPAWLGERGLPAPTTGYGISMGCFGILRWAREQHQVDGIGLVGPALFRSWADAKGRNAFPNERAWAANEPLRHTKDIAGIPLGVWCGTDDPFVDSARQLVARVEPEVADIGPGRHEGGYFLRVTPDVMRFIGGKSG